MVERVETGGVMSFDYSKVEKQRKISEEEKQEIRKGYEEYNVRKKLERRKKMMLIILVVIIILSGILALIF